MIKPATSQVCNVQSCLGTCYYVESNMAYYNFTLNKDGTFTYYWDGFQLGNFYETHEPLVYDGYSYYRGELERITPQGNKYQICRQPV